MESWFKEERAVSFKFLNNLFKVFHISSRLLNPKKFTFTPRIPSNPFEDGRDRIEDDFTKRISLGPTIEKCIEALSGLDEMAFLYAADFRLIPDDDVEVIKLATVYFPTCVKNLSTSSNRYGSKGYKLAHFLDYKGIESEEWQEIKEKYMKGCVPDSKTTKEMWSLKPVSMHYIGEVLDSTVTLSTACRKLFSFVAEKYSKQYGKLLSGF
jgi:hypothetical protein